jgi:exopolyphosphatase/guanosine-5'-triphosphate,3'-diphosphate pyrophosphatase
LRAAVDIGTNTVRLLLGEVVDGSIRSPQYRQTITRLGGGMTKQEGLTPAAMERTLSALQSYAAFLNPIPLVHLRVVATEALRRAVNAAAFVRKVREQTDFCIEIISGAEEARLSACGVLSVLSPLPKHSLVFDIGGGSIEFILLQGRHIQFHQSYPLGVVDLAEQAPLRNPERAIKDTLLALLLDLAHLHPKGLPAVELIGTAGTLTTLAALALEMKNYDRTLVNNHILQRTWLLETYERLSVLTPKQREKLPGIEQGRGDLILPGLQIVLAMLTAFESDRVVVSDAGLLEGILLCGKDRS